MKTRDNFIGRSMPRKSKHGHKLSRYFTHREMKRFRNRRSKRDI